MKHITPGKIISPCIQACALKDGSCAGCGRSRDEIGRWSKMSNEERLSIIDRLDRVKGTPHAK